MTGHLAHLRRARLVLAGSPWARALRVRLALLEASGAQDREAVRAMIGDLLEHGDPTDPARLRAAGALRAAWEAGP